MENFIQLQEEIFTFLCQEKPVNATYLGIKGFDTFLDSFDQMSLISCNEKREVFLNRLEQIEKPALAINLAIDFEILKNKLEVDLELNKKYRALYRNANIYLETCLYGIYYLSLRKSLTHEQKALAIIERLKQIPATLTVAKENLSKGENIPEIWTKMAIEMAQGGIAFLNHLVDEQIKIEAIPTLKTELENSGKKAVKAINKFKDFLEIDLLFKSNGNFAVGKEIFNFLLNKSMHLPYNTGQLLEIARKMFNETEVLLNETAKLIDPEKSWKEIITEESRNFLAHDQLLYFYREELERIKKFIKDQDLLTLPDNETLEVVDTPEFERNKVPFASYICPPPFGQETERKGYFWVTPGDINKGGQNKYMATMVSIHEGYPGHHLQFVITNSNPSKVRKYLYDNSFIEGWALYWEENMYLNGYCKDDPLLRIFQLRNQIWRCCRVIIDVEMHTGNMSFDEAVNMLVEKADLERANAISEVKRYTMTPTQPMSYIIGKYEIMKLKEELKVKMKEAFSLKYFHDALLACGPISLPLVGKILL